MEVSYTQIMDIAENVCSNCERAGDDHYCDNYCEITKLINMIEKDGANYGKD